ncbi:Lipid A export ATP-binding/permease protein MsbA [compost metagenome]
MLFCCAAALCLCDPLRGDIVFDQVAFGYEERRPVLQNLSLNIRAGETIAFVGPSGAGKTTVCSLLPRFYEVTGGGIAIDGTDIRRFKLESLRRQIGIVQQDVFLFSGTIRENIAYGKLDAGIDEIWEAAIQQSLAELSVGRTTLVIAHRLSTIRSADRIIVVAEDGIAEEGQHEELVEAGGIYSRLHQAQLSS